MLFKLEDINLDFGDKILFNKLNFVFNKGDKIRIIGENGTGKSSLFNIILRKQEYSGNILFENNNFGYLSQDEGFIELKLISSRKDEIEKLLLKENIINDIEKYNKLFDEYNQLVLNSSNQKELNLIKKFNFNPELYQKEKKENLSGGESTKLKLIKLFSQDFKYYLLDEPSNHLDIKSKNILSNALKEFPGSILVVSHDNYFLDEFVNRKIKIVNGKLN